LIRHSSSFRLADDVQSDRIGQSSQGELRPRHGAGKKKITMATTKVGIYRSYRGPVTLDDTGQPLPESEWPRKRLSSWVVRWFGEDGNRYSKSFENRKEAEKFAETKQSEVRQGNGDPPRRCSLREFFTEHRQLSKGSVSRGTLLMHAGVMKQLAAQIGCERDLRSIAPRTIESFRARRTEAGLSAWTVNKEVKQLKTLFNLAIRRGHLRAGKNPCVGVTLLRTAEKRPAYMSPEQFEQVYANAGSLLARAELVLIYTTGLRRQEAPNLTWDDIDFDRAVVHVARHDRAGYVQAWTPKDHERRELPLPKQATELIRQVKAVAPPGCPYVFMDAGRWAYYRDQVDRNLWKDHRHVINNSLRKFKTVCKRAGVGKFTLHDLRRSCITNWARQGLPIHVTQKLAGHADINTTQTFCLSVQDDDLNVARRAQQRIVKGLSDVVTTDQKLTNSTPNRCFPRRKEFEDGTQLPSEKAVA